MKEENKFIVNTYKLMGIILLLMCLIIIYTLDISNHECNDLYRFFAIISLLELIIFLCFNTKLTKKFLNFACIFASCLYLFNFGQVFLMGFFPTASEKLTIVLEYFQKMQLFYGLKILNNLIVIIYISILLSYTKNKKINMTINLEEDKVYLKNKALIIICITLPIKLSIDLVMLYIGLTKGFSESKVFLLSIPDMIVTFGKFSILGFYLLMISLKENKDKQKMVYIFIVIYIMITMLTGRRSENVAYICIFTYIYLSNKRINIKNLLIFSIMAFLGLAFLNALVYNRNNSVGIVHSFIYTLKNKNIIFEVFREYGNTVYTSLIVIIEWLPQYTVSLGKSYYMGLSAIMPNLYGIMGNLTLQSNYGSTLKSFDVLYQQYTNIGGSLIGELLFNFGVYFSIIGSVIIGFGVGRVSKKAQELIISSYNYNSIYYLNVMAGVLYWIRDYFSGIIREIVWGAIFCWIISRIKLNTEREENEKN